MEIQALPPKRGAVFQAFHENEDGQQGTQIVLALAAAALAAVLLVPLLCKLRSVQEWYKSLSGNLTLDDW